MIGTLRKTETEIEKLEIIKCSNMDNSGNLLENQRKGQNTKKVWNFVDYPEARSVSVAGRGVREVKVLMAW